MTAPVCKISRSQVTAPMPPIKMPAIPIATDLPSLIRSINIMRDIIRNITTSLTVNNVVLPREQQPSGSYLFIMSDYPSWEQVGINTSYGFVFYKTKADGKDETQRAFVKRINAVEYTNTKTFQDNSFIWRLEKPLDAEYGAEHGPQPFKEDFFERIVNVKWGEGLAVEFLDGFN